MYLGTNASPEEIVRYGTDEQVRELAVESAEETEELYAEIEVLREQSDEFERERDRCLEAIAEVKHYLTHADTLEKARDEIFAMFIRSGVNNLE